MLLAGARSGHSLTAYSGWVGAVYMDIMDIMDIDIATPETIDPLAGTVVVIDVLRAFTTSAFAFAAGAREIFLVASIPEALDLRTRMKGAQIMGEESGFKVESFDAGNSPLEFVDRDVAPQWIQRTSAGTPAAAAAAARAENVIVASFVCAAATVRYVRALRPPRVVLVVSGAVDQQNGEDDRACAEYLALSLQGKSPSAGSFLKRMADSPAAAKFFDPLQPEFRREDLTMAAELDRFNFAMVARQTDQHLIVKPDFTG